MSESREQNYIIAVQRLIYEAEEIFRGLTDQISSLEGRISKESIDEDTFVNIASCIEKTQQLQQMVDHDNPQLTDAIEGVSRRLRELSGRSAHKGKNLSEDQMSLTADWRETETLFRKWMDDYRMQIGNCVECLLEDLCMAVEVTGQLDLHCVYDADGAMSWLGATAGFLAVGRMTDDVQNRWVKTDELRFTEPDDSEIVWWTISLDYADDDQILQMLSRSGSARFVLLANLSLTGDRARGIKKRLPFGWRGICLERNGRGQLLIDRTPPGYREQLIIYTVAHKPFTPPDDILYRPIHAGKNGQEGFGYAGDDTGDHISELNGYLNELTALYWIWKNDTHPYVGINHYRRYFAWRGLPYAKGTADEEDILGRLEKCDMLVWEPVYTAPATVEWQLEATLDNDRLFRLVMDELRKQICRHCPEYEEAFLSVMRGYRFYPKHIFVARREIFDAYCTWLFDLLPDTLYGVLKRETMEERGRNPRLVGFAAERLLTVWLEKQDLRIQSLHGYYVSDSGV